MIALSAAEVAAATGGTLTSAAGRDDAGAVTVTGPVGA